jgi:NAD(P) transhydrogenase subunit beta
MVGLLNGLGGGASTLVAVGECWRLMAQPAVPLLDSLLTTLLGMLIGAITLTGSFVAFGKLQGIITGAPVIFPLQQSLNGVLLLAFLAGGADMPVVTSLLNAFSGLAASAVGFVFANQALIIAGALVGASGLILTRIMCSAMNRSLANVLFSGFGTGDGAAGVAESAGTEQRVRAIDAEEGAVIIAHARLVITMPGYGMAAAQAQHAVCELAEQLERRGIDVK